MRRYLLCALVTVLWVQSTRAHAQSSVLGQTVAGEGEGDAQSLLRGFDLSMTLWESSGINFSDEAYENQLTFYFQPSYALGRQFFRGKWAERLSVSARFFFTAELAGNSASFRSTRFAAPGVLRDLPEVTAATVIEPSTTPSGQVTGPNHRLAASDFWLIAAHDRVWVIPKVGIDISADVRVALPSSLESRTAGMIATPSVFIDLGRKFWRIRLDYGFRFVKYFYKDRVAPIASLADPIVVNGLVVDPYRPQSSTIANPNFGFSHSFMASVELPYDLSIFAGYFLYNTMKHGFGTCSVDGVPTADLCADGQALGDARSPSQLDQQWFLVEFDWHARSWLTAGIGLSTFGPVRAPDGGINNPFVRTTRDNYTTIYLSLTVTAEAAAKALHERFFK